VEGRAGPDGDDATLDLDATIVRTKAGKEDAPPTHKRTYGHHPLAAMLAETGELLAGMFRPGNAGVEFIEIISPLQLGCLGEELDLADVGIAGEQNQLVAAGVGEGADGVGYLC
jgi:hypothetical protein